MGGSETAGLKCADCKEGQCKRSTCNKIDRAVVNAEWMMNMNQLEITIMQPEWKEYGMEDTKGI
ncbi:hypothetical protein KY290_031446 [Solanum tuberosum]|uniref:Uncharacterized protein n=1 Tax=Solanum tuberosum TaxID=4113 RepID=A0ABQ7UAD3_SOLTU|nr:hypothetical protein KY289_030837 [Solanum tuberosum]KAH0743453.1 hypothetical protein KY290_031446 [Solanum tuberosum]